MKVKMIKNYSPNSRHDLLKVFSEVGNQFELVSNEISQRNKLITNGLMQLKNRVTAEPWEESELKQNHEFKAKTDKHLKKIRRLMEAWVEDAENYDKGTEFRSRFNDSLLIFVFGKVKAGKSSLGNFLAYGHSEPSLAIIETSSPAPDFFWEAGNNSTEAMSSDVMLRNRCFGVGRAETTSSIQGFTLPGITWVDSPGVHSTKVENEDLTKEYAKAADVIIFLSNSSEPGRRSDIEEIMRLLGQDKPLIVIITASDSLEKDIDDNGKIVQRLCMKSTEDRQGQVDLVSKAIEGFSSKTQVLTVSLKYAENVEKNETETQILERWRDSGMQDLGKELAKISVSQGVTVKRTAPLRNLKVFCQTLLGTASVENDSSISDELTSIDSLNASLKKIQEMLKEERATIAEKCKNVLPKIRSSLTQKIQTMADKHVMDDDAFINGCTSGFTFICAKYEAEIGEQFISAFDGFTFNSIMERPSFPKFTPRFATRHHISKTAENVGKAAGTGGGAWAGAEAGAAAGLLLGPVGVFVGGLLGAGIGGWFGGKAGEYVGENFNTTETIFTKVGDNREEVVEAVCKDLIKKSELYMIEVARKLDEICFENLENWLKNIQTSLNSFRRKLECQIEEINKELDHGIT